MPDFHRREVSEELARVVEIENLQMRNYSRESVIPARSNARVTL